MASIAFESPVDRHTSLNGPRSVDPETLDAFGTRAMYVESDPGSQHWSGHTSNFSAQRTSSTALEATR